MSPGFQVGHHARRFAARAQQPVPRSLLPPRIQQVVPALGVNSSVASSKVAAQGALARQARGKLAPPASVTLPMLAVALRRIKRSPLNSTRAVADLHRLAQPGNLGACVLQLRVAAQFGPCKLQPCAVEGQIHVGRAAHGNPGSPDSRRPRQFLQPLQPRVALQSQMILPAVELAFHAHRSGPAQRQSKTLQHPARAHLLLALHGALYRAAQCWPWPPCAAPPVPCPIRSSAAPARQSADCRSAPVPHRPASLCGSSPPGSLRRQILWQSGTRSPRQVHHGVRRHVVGRQSSDPTADGVVRASIRARSARRCPVAAGSRPGAAPSRPGRPRRCTSHSARSCHPDPRRSAAVHATAPRWQSAAPPESLPVAHWYPVVRAIPGLRHRSAWSGCPAALAPRSHWPSSERRSAALRVLPSPRPLMVPVSLTGISVRTGRAASRMRHWPSAELKSVKSASVSEKALFSNPCLKLMRPLVTSM